ncbi:MAG: DUF4406 domain-containing protein [Mesorhizobium sp.]|nr:MAG: DUF4406 domain-containing protein [Mesorhizobium sp.]
MSRVYIAGPMTDMPDFNRPAFRREAERLNSEGYAVLNPATLPDGLSQAQYMDICIAMVRCANTVFMLQGWEKSAGARAEHAMAEKLDLEIIYQEKNSKQWEINRMLLSLLLAQCFLIQRAE